MLRSELLRRAAWGLAALSFSAHVAWGSEGEGDRAAPVVELRSLVIRGSATGRKPDIFVYFLGRPTRAKLLEANDDGVTVSVTGNEMSIPWEKLSPESLASAAAKFVTAGAEEFAIARFLAGHSLFEKAREACDRAASADPSLAKEVEALLGFCREKQAPDLSKIIAVYAPDKKRVARGPRRRNHEGRPLPPMPPIKRPVTFNTPEADRILAAMQVFPRDNPWNEDVSRLPVHANSDDIVASIGAEKRFQYNLDMCFIIVPPDQPRARVEFDPYPRESDREPYPIPDSAPIEGWPLGIGDNGGDLEELQRSGRGDRHVIVVDPVGGRLYELFCGYRTDTGWKGYGCIFDLTSNKLRPRGRTSADAAGLPIFPAVVRFDECERGMVEHAMRVTCRRTRREFIYPATHHASPHTNPDFPAMGQRLRLKAGVDISGFPRHARAVALGLKKYGMFVADNGGDWRMSIAPDRRIRGLEALRRLRGRDFEVVRTTGPREGPRATPRPRLAEKKPVGERKPAGGKKHKEPPEPAILPHGTGEDEASSAGPGSEKESVRKKPPVPEIEEPVGTREPEVDAESAKLFKRAETLFIEGRLEEAAAILRKIVEENPGTGLAAKAGEYLEMIE